MDRGASRRAFLTGRLLHDTEPPLPRAPLPGRCGTPEALRALAEESVLAARVDAVERLARTSVRVEAAAVSARRGWTQLGGRPATGADAAAWPPRRRLLVQIALRELPAVPTGWPERDDLVLLYRDEPGGAVGAVRAPLPRRRWRSTPRRTGVSAVLAAESTLPRAWAAPVQALGLDRSESDAWQALRSEWAAAQDAELEDEVHGARVVHRLGGYPDERSGTMPALCELRAAGIEGEDGDPHRRVAEAGLTERLPRWRLLAQLSSDPELGWDWGGPRSRLYVWADASDLESGDLSTVTAFAR
jgi:Domain of unknown function (DUF1963)